MQFVPPDARNPPDSVCERAEGRAERGSLLFPPQLPGSSRPPPIALSSTHQVKYKEEGRKEAGASLYSALPDTLDTQRARELAALQSQVEPPGSSVWRRDRGTVHQVT